MSGLAEERLEVLAEHLRLPDLPVLLPQIAEGAVAGEHFNALHCAFRPSRTAIPRQAEQRFRFKPNTSERSDAFALLSFTYCSASGQLVVLSLPSSA